MARTVSEKKYQQRSLVEARDSESRRSDPVGTGDIRIATNNFSDVRRCNPQGEMNMKYMQNGGFHKNPMMRLTLWFTLFFLTGFVVTNFLLYFAKMDLTPSSVVMYYNGSEENFRPARTYQSMLEVTHGHMIMMGVVLLLLTHLMIFAPFSKAKKITFISTAFLSGFFNEASGWLVRFVHPDFAWLKVISFITLQASLLFLLLTLGIFLFLARRESLQSMTEDNELNDGVDAENSATDTDGFKASPLPYVTDDTHRRVDVRDTISN